MGAETTIKVTRHAARKYLLARVMDATDDDLSEMLDHYMAERLYNTYILPDGETENDDEILEC